MATYRRSGLKKAPILIASIFYKGDKLVLNSKLGIVDRQKVEDQIQLFINLCQEFGIRCGIDVEYETIEALSKYLEIVLPSVPEDYLILIDSGSQNLRIEAAKLLNELGLDHRVIINSINIKSIPDELNYYTKLNLKGFVISNYSPDINERIKLTLEMIEKLKDYNLQNRIILIDLPVMDLPDLVNTLSTLGNIRNNIPNEYLLGLAPANVVITWRKVDYIFEKLKHRFKDLTLGMFRTSLRIFSTIISIINPFIDFVFFGPIKDSIYVVTAVAYALSTDIEKLFSYTPKIEEGKIIKLILENIGEIELGFKKFKKVEVFEEVERFAKEKDMKSKLKEMIVNLDEKAIDYVKLMLEHGVKPVEIIDILREAMEVIGEKYEKGEYFISELITAGEIGEKIVELLEEKFKYELGKSRARIVLGTIEGDIHSIGKNIVKMVLIANGFEVIDLGVDVSINKFIEAIEKYKPDVVGVSALITTAATNIGRLVNELEKYGLRNKVKIIIGGAAVNEELAREFKVDAYAKDAFEALVKIKQLLGIS